MMVKQMENTEEAIIELQTKLSFQEDLLENLNQVIIDQQGQITKLELVGRIVIRRMLCFTASYHL